MNPRFRRVDARPRKTPLLSDDDEFPDIGALVSSRKLPSDDDAPSAQPATKGRVKLQVLAAPTPTVRRRKLGTLTDNLLLKAWTPDNAGDSGEERYSVEGETAMPRRARVELRTRKTKTVALVSSPPVVEDDEYVSAKEEVTIVEEVSICDDTFHSCASESSEGSDFSVHEDKDSEDDDSDFLLNTPPRRQAAKPKAEPKSKKQLGQAEVKPDRESTSRRALSQDRSACQDPPSKSLAGRKGVGKAKEDDEELAATLSELHL